MNSTLCDNNILMDRQEHSKKNNAGVCMLMLKVTKSNNHAAKRAAFCAQMGVTADWKAMISYNYYYLQPLQKMWSRT